MYCQFCGTEATHELNYCKRCGNNLNPPASLAIPDARPAVSGRVAFAVGATTLFTVLGGLLALFQGLIELARSGVHHVAIVWIGFFAALTIIGSLALFIWLWWRVLGVSAPRPVAKIPQLSRPSFTNELSGARAPTALPDPIPASVTEHTTRTFDALYSEPRRRE